jgi:magnesium transporter
MIEIFGYDTQKSTYRTDITVDDLTGSLSDENCFLWLDFENPTPEEINILRHVFHLDELAIEDCIHSRQSPKLESFTHYHFFIVQEPTAANVATSNLIDHNVELDGFLADRYLITYHVDSIASIQDAKRHIRRENSRIAQGTAYLAYEILDQMVDRYLPILDHLEERIRLLSIQLQNNPMDDRSAQDYSNLSTHILDLRRIAAKNQQVFYQFSHSSLRFIDADEARLFRDIHDHMVRVMDMSEYYQHTLHDALNIQLSLNANRVNQVVQFLTIWATIMLPLNVMTGIYGMNFSHMPLLTSPYGFWITIGLMIAIVTVLLTYFHRRKWI